jgi:hypothetical protein
VLLVYGVKNFRVPLMMFANAEAGESLRPSCSCPRRFSGRTTNRRLEFDGVAKCYAVRCHARSLRTEKLIQRVKYIAQHDAVVRSLSQAYYCMTLYENYATASNLPPRSC